MIFFLGDDCLFTYWKMFQNGGFANSLATNSISYEDFKQVFFYQYCQQLERFDNFESSISIVLFLGCFKVSVTKFHLPRNGYYFVVNELSTSGRSGSSNLIPAIRVGHLRLRVLFSEALPLDLACILHCESPATMYVNKTGHVTGSYI